MTTVRLHQTNNDHRLIGNHSGGSRSLAGAGSVCAVAARKLIEVATPLAAEALAVEPSQIRFADGVFAVRDDTRTITLAALAARYAQGHSNPLVVIGEASVGSTFPNACHVAEVEVDPETGKVDIVAYTAVDDCGNVINHAVVEGQVMGAVAQGVGQVLGEQVVYDRASGQLLTGSFMDYPMPRAGLIRAMTLDACPVPSSTNVLGAKGVGEAGCGGSMPAMANAVMNALRACGVAHLDMPMTPNKVWHSLEKTRASAARSR